MVEKLLLIFDLNAQEPSRLKSCHIFITAFHCDHLRVFTLSLQDDTEERD